MGTTVHEIAQINIARKYTLDGNLVYLEHPSPNKNGEIDVAVFGKGNPFVWEVKPWGKSGKSQVEKYTKDTKFGMGSALTIRDISIIPGAGAWQGLYMGISGTKGVANYYFYTKDKNGHDIKVDNSVAMVAALAAQTALKKAAEAAGYAVAAPLALSIVDGVPGDEVAIMAGYMKAIEAIAPMLNKLIPCK